MGVDTGLDFYRKHGTLPNIGSDQLINPHLAVVKRFREPVYVIAVDHPGKDGFLL